MRLPVLLGRLKIRESAVSPNFNSKSGRYHRLAAFPAVLARLDLPLRAHSSKPKAGYQDGDNWSE